MPPHPPDLHNFSSSDSHRLPTVSASAALRRLADEGGLAVPTGLKGLDRILGGGWKRGEVTEVWGPPGVGKTACCMQAAASALHAGDEVVWIGTISPCALSTSVVILTASPTDTGTPLPFPRLAAILSHSSPAPAPQPRSSPLNNLTSPLNNLTYHFTPTLPHLLALLTFLSSLPLSTASPSLLIIDTITSLFATAFPLSTAPAATKNERAQWAASRRFAVMSEFLARLGKLAVVRNVAVVLVSAATTRVRREEGTAVLRPGISTRAWEEGVGARVAVLRDWEGGRGGEGREGGGRAVRFAGVMKLGGVVYEGVGRVVAFTVENEGLREVSAPEDDGGVGGLVLGVGPALALKRKREEVVDSESEEEEVGSDEEFGWRGAEGGMVEGLEGVDSGTREGGDGGSGVPAGDEGRGESVERVSEEEPEEAELRDLIDEALEEDMHIMDQGYDDIS